MTSRLPALDALRGVAILLVLGHHAAVEPQRAGAFSPLAILWRRVGWTGVDLFFVLSGFLVGGLLMNELQCTGTLNVRRFLVRRAFKIWPAYLIYITCLFIPLTRVNPKCTMAAAARLLASNYVHAQNYLPTVRGHTWSLAVEEHFYLVLPCLLLALRWAPGGERQASLPWCCAAAILLGLVLRCWQNAGRTFASQTHLYPTHLRMDALFFGVLLAYAQRWRPAILQALQRRPKLLAGLGLALLSPMAVLELERSALVWTVGFTLLYAGYGCILLAALSAAHPRRAQARWAPLELLGRHSYSVYLWHVDLAMLPVLAVRRHAVGASLPSSGAWLLFMAVYLILACAGGVFCSMVCERPFLRVRERYFPATIRPPLTPTADLAALENLAA